MISQKARIGARFVIVAFLIGVALATAVVLVIRHGGPISKRVALQDELVADVLPPPAFVVESYLHAAVILHDPSRAASEIAELKEEHETFKARKAYWESAPVPEAMRPPLAGTLETAERFWSVIDQKFLPAVQAGDQAAMSAIFDQELTRAYHEQHGQVAQLVELSLKIKANDDSADLVRIVVAMAFLGLMAAAAVFVILWLTRVLDRMILNPLTATADAMHRMADGDYTITAVGAERDDEIGAMAKAMDVFRESGIARLQAAADQEVVVVTLSNSLERLAKKDLEVRIEQSFPASYEELRRNFNSTVEALAGAMRIVRVGAANVRDSIGEIHAASDDLANRNEQQAARLADTASAMNAITTSIRETAEGAVNVQQSIASAHREATEGGDVVRRAIDAMAAIESSADEIGKIVTVIDGIAFQTNLLALNAGVEAARAGDSGKGFAVVANEVRALAQRSAEAAQDIKSLITTSSQQVGTGVALVGQTGEKLVGIVSRVGEITRAISDMAEAAQDQAVSLQQINGAVGEMDLMTQQNAAMVEESSAAARSLASEAGRLTELVTGFRTRDIDRRPASLSSPERHRRASALDEPRKSFPVALAS